MQAYSQDTIKDLIHQHNGPLLILDCARVAKHVQALQNALPNTYLYYAIKACDHAPLLQWMHQNLDIGFDIASGGEINQLRQAQVYTQNTIHTHPIKTDAEIRAALRYGCSTFVFDNRDELLKLKPYAKRIGLLLRLNFSCQQAAVPLAKKFGAPVAEALDLIKLAAKNGLHVKGLSSHVGSQTPSPDAHVRAIQASRIIFQQAAAYGLPLRVLDIGGGFPSQYLHHSAPDIHTFCQPIQQALQNWPQHVKIIAEPGRYLVAAAGTSVCRIIGRATRQGKAWYYIDDGVYGSFSGQIYDGMRYQCYPIQQHSDSNYNTTYASVIAGPSCDSIDIIHEDIQLPKLAIGDIIVHHCMGAYTSVSASKFNRLTTAKTILYNSHIKVHTTRRAPLDLISLL